LRELHHAEGANTDTTHEAIRQMFLKA
jgi:hypothetical protein